MARLWHAATLLREHRGDGHKCRPPRPRHRRPRGPRPYRALPRHQGGEGFGRIHHLPQAQLAAVVDGLRGRGLVDAAGGYTNAGRETKKRVEALTDELASSAHDVLNADELDELIVGLEPIAAAA